MGGYLGAGAEPQEFDGLLSGFFEVDVGVRGEVVGAQNIGLTGMLHAQLRADKGEALALDLHTRSLHGRESVGAVRRAAWEESGR